MTTIFEEEVTCAVCGSKQMVQEIGSTNTFGATDLDTRPPEMKRSTMPHWVHECEECGYVAPELASATDGAGRIVASADYRAELKRKGRPRLANRFVCRSLLEVAAGDLVSAGWQRLHAAWTCDDEEKDDEARTQRRAALAQFETARAAGQSAMKSVVGGDDLLLADIARRAGEFGRAEAYLAAGLALQEVPAFVTKLLLYQRELVQKGDTGRHTVAEAEGAPSGGTVH